MVPCLTMAHQLVCTVSAQGASSVRDSITVKMVARDYPMCVFFQAEDGIRDIGVTGVQTCALPISRMPSSALKKKKKKLKSINLNIMYARFLLKKKKTEKERQYKQIYE